MTSVTVRIKEKTRDMIRQLANKEGDTMQAILEKAVETYRRKQFLDEVNDAYGILRDKPQKWSELEKEREAWDGTLMDGLENEEQWVEDKGEQ